MPDGRKIPLTAKLPVNVEESPRNAKDWWKKCIGSYKQTLDQALSPVIGIQRLPPLEATTTDSRRRLRGTHVISPD